MYHVWTIEYVYISYVLSANSFFPRLWDKVSCLFLYLRMLCV
jgi:hypothetical protein